MLEVKSLGEVDLWLLTSGSEFDLSDYSGLSVVRIVVGRSDDDLFSNLPVECLTSRGLGEENPSLALRSSGVQLGPVARSLASVHLEETAVDCEHLVSEDGD